MIVFEKQTGEWKEMEGDETGDRTVESLIQLSL